MKNSKFKIINTTLEDVFVLQNLKIQDNRGYLVKTFCESDFKELKLPINFKETVYTFSKKNVLRGMHYQSPPHSSAKLVNVLQGEILDVILEVPVKSAKKSNFFSTILSEKNCKSVYIPKGYAHGFLCLSDTAIVSYQITEIFSKKNDKGFKYDSFGFDWPIKKPIINKKDLDLPKFYAL